MENKFIELRKLNVSDHIEKKNGLSYLSWSWAVDTLLQQDPNATWEFPEPKYYGETVMVYCDVTAFGKTMKMHLPVMDFRNQAVKNPSSVDINKAMMRCLAKCIACFGIGLYIYSGDDLPDDSTPGPVANPLDALVTKQATSLENVEKKSVESSENTTPVKITGQYELRVPGKDSTFYQSITDWMTAYNNLADKVAESTRMGRDTKKQKLEELSQANHHVIHKLNAVQIAGMNTMTAKRRTFIEATV
jgi:hypothetical protein